MLSAKFIGKRVFISLFSFFFFIILPSCNSSNRVWECSSNTGILDDYCSTRLCLAPENKFTGLHLEVINTSKGMLGFLNLCGLALKEECRSADDSSEVIVTVSTSEKTQTFKCFLFKGGHRVRLRNEALDMIIRELKCNRVVSISVGHYSSEIISDEFSGLFEKHM